MLEVYSRLAKILVNAWNIRCRATNISRFVFKISFLASILNFIACFIINRLWSQTEWRWFLYENRNMKAERRLSSHILDYMSILFPGLYNDMYKHTVESILSVPIYNFELLLSTSRVWKLRKLGTTFLDVFGFYLCEIIEVLWFEIWNKNFVVKLVHAGGLRQSLIAINSFSTL